VSRSPRPFPPAACVLAHRPGHHATRHRARVGMAEALRMRDKERQNKRNRSAFLSQVSSLCLSRACLGNCWLIPVACARKMACTIERRRKFSHLVPWAFVAGSVRPAALAVMAVEEALTPGPCVVLALRVVVDSHRALGAVLDPARNERTNTQRKKRARMRPTRESNQRDAREKN
jgi:hypothetical protein